MQPPDTSSPPPGVVTATAARSNAVAPTVATLVLVAGWVALQPSAGRFVNADTSAYLSLAARWLDGDVAAAVSGYWGPLLSWCTAPLLALGVPRLAAVRLVVLAGAVATLWVAAGGLRRLGVEGPARGWVLAALVPYLLWHAVHGVYPETVCNALLLGGTLTLSRPRLGPGRATAGGALLGAAYLAKAVGLPLGLGVLAVVAVLRLVASPRVRRADVLRSVGVSVLALGVVAGSWVAVLSVREGSPTWSTAADFNADLVGSRGNPLLLPGLYELPFPEARSPWDEPGSIRATADVDVRPGEQAASPSAVVGNLRVTIGAVARRAAVPAALGAAGLWLAVRRSRRSPWVAVAAVALAALAAGDVAGYLLVIVIERYLWLPMLVATILTGVLLAQLRGSRTLTVLGAVLVAGTTLGAVTATVPRLGDHAEVVTVAESVPADLLRGADVAAVRDWSRTSALCVRLDCAFRGSTGRDPAGELSALRDADVDVVVRWQDAPASDGSGPVDDGRVVLLEVTRTGLVELAEVDVTG